MVRHWQHGTLGGMSVRVAGLVPRIRLTPTIAISPSVSIGGKVISGTNTRHLEQRERDCRTKKSGNPELKLRAVRIKAYLTVRRSPGTRWWLSRWWGLR